VADASDIEAVRLYADVRENVSPFSDVTVEGLIDSLGVAGATAELIRRRLPELEKLVDTTEAGASHKLSSIATAAQKRLAYWEARAGASGDPTVVAGSGTRVKKIVRS
jgi:hypothetical protein